jgi:hypothetical protein
VEQGQDNNFTGALTAAKINMAATDTATSTKRGVAMKHVTLFLAAVSLSACQSMRSNDPSSLLFKIPPGSTLSLNKNLEITEGNTHAQIQHGKLTSESQRNQYELGCRVNFKEFGPRTVTPEIFNIQRTEDNEGWVSRPNIYFYSTEIYLSSGKGTDIIKMECGNWATWPSSNFSIADIEQTLGDYFSFTFKPSETTKQ